MKKILVTYHMKSEFETAETCIELPISDKLEALADGHNPRQPNAWNIKLVDSLSTSQ